MWAAMTIRSDAAVAPGISATSVLAGPVENELEIVTRTETPFAPPAASRFLNVEAARGEALKPNALRASSYGTLLH